MASPWVPNEHVFNYCPVQFASCPISKSCYSASPTSVSCRRSVQANQSTRESKRPKVTHVSVPCIQVQSLQESAAKSVILHCCRMELQMFHHWEDPIFSYAAENALLTGLGLARPQYLTPSVRLLPKLWPSCFCGPPQRRHSRNHAFVRSRRCCTQV